MNKRANGNTEETHFGVISLRDMIVDERYQATLSASFVRQMGRWDAEQAGVIYLNMREDGTFAILDGQHRVELARTFGVVELPAWVYVGLTVEQEAGKFVGFQVRQQKRALALFKANWGNGKIREKNIVHALREIGLDVAGLGGSSQREDQLKCVGALISIYEKHGINFFKIVLGALNSAFREFPHRSRAYTSEAISGLAKFVERFPKAPIPSVIERLRAIGPNGMVDASNRNRKKREDKATAWARGLHEEYNDALPKRSQHRLSEEFPRVVYSEKAVAERAVTARHNLERLRAKGAAARSTRADA